MKSILFLLFAVAVTGCAFQPIADGGVRISECEEHSEIYLSSSSYKILSAAMCSGQPYVFLATVPKTSSPSNLQETVVERIKLPMLKAGEYVNVIPFCTLENGQSSEWAGVLSEEDEDAIVSAWKLDPAGKLVTVSAKDIAETNCRMAGTR